MSSGAEGVHHFTPLWCMTLKFYTAEIIKKLTLLCLTDTDFRFNLYISCGAHAYSTVLSIPHYTPT